MRKLETTSSRRDGNQSVLAVGVCRFTNQSAANTALQPARAEKRARTSDWSRRALANKFAPRLCSFACPLGRLADPHQHSQDRLVSDYHPIVYSDGRLGNDTVCVKQDRIRPTKSAVVAESHMARSIYLFRF